MSILSRSIFASSFAIALATSGTSQAAVVMTDSAGGGQAFSNYQPSLVINQLVATGGQFPSRSSTRAAGQTLGMIRNYAGIRSVFGAPQAQGQRISISQNTALFSIYGTQYGGNGRTDFALPDLGGRAAIGSGQGAGLSNFRVGQQTGAAATTLSLANLPAHSHGLPDGSQTSVQGGGQSFDNYQPSLAMTYMISTTGLFPSRSISVDDARASDGTTFLGRVSLFGGNFAPEGWMKADGSILAIRDNQALFSILGTTYGGDGRTTFALPDLRGRAIVGAGQGPGFDNVRLGEKTGSADTTLTSDQMPMHDHGLPDGGTTDQAGGTTIIDTSQPGLGLNYLVALTGIFPSSDGTGTFPEGAPFLGEVTAFAGNFAPRGWALAQGQLLSIAQNSALFSLLGTTYGGDGRSTFALPDLRGRLLIGANDQFQLGQRIGTDSTLLTVANLPAHAHEFEVASGVPEPTTWAMMIVGFGLVGGALRRRKTTVKVSYA